jgi:predicted amidohydrolase
VNNLKVSFIQSHLHWENPVENRAQFSEKIQSILEEIDLIILPEMFTTGFTMNASEVAEPHKGISFQWMQEQAKLKNAAITGSLIIEEDGKYYNRLYFVFPDGSFQQYDKRHTFTLAGEHAIFENGNERLVVTYKGWSICPLICYDLRFPVWARNTAEYHVLIYCANWPKRRITAWDTLLKARAIENMSYCIGVNRVGLDGNGHEYTGHSAAYDVLGERFENPIFESDGISTVTLDMDHLIVSRKHLQFLNDRDRFNLE